MEATRCRWAQSASRCSNSSFVCPYGLTGTRGASSGIGIRGGWPYTAHDDEKITRRTPTATTAWPCASSCSTTTLPMYPAPPVTRTLRAIRPLQAEQLLQRLEEAVTAPRLRGLLERNRGGVQKLVEQRVAELLHLGPILGRQVRKALEGTLQLRGAHVVEAPAKLFQHRHHSQPA